MYLCYVDESGTSDIPGNTSHFVLAALSIPVWHWRDCEREIESIKKTYQLMNAEIHVAWILRPYLEQRKIPNFEDLDYHERVSQVERYRKAELLRLQRSGNRRLYNQVKKNYRQTGSDVHLTFTERQTLALEITQCISRWGFARLFAECIDKIHFDPTRAKLSVSEQSFEQIVSRFEQYLQNVNRGAQNRFYGMLIYDNNQTVAKKHTELMKRFHQKGTLWTEVQNIIETPLFVDSQLTSLVQIADVCAYALRRYLENSEDTLFDNIFQRADRRDDVVVGVRHFTTSSCSCKICRAHRR